MINAIRLRPTRRSVITILSVTLIGLSLLIALRVGKAKVRSQQQSDPASTVFTIAAPYWSVEGGFISTIEMKNYRVDQSLTITPILYPLHGPEVALDAVTLNPSETRVLNINDALAARDKHFTVGAAEIRYKNTTESV